MPRNQAKTKSVHQRIRNLDVATAAVVPSSSGLRPSPSAVRHTLPPPLRARGRVHIVSVSKCHFLFTNKRFLLFSDSALAAHIRFVSESPFGEPLEADIVT